MVTYRAVIESTDEWLESPSFQRVFASAYWLLQMYDRDEVCHIYAVTDSRSYPEEGGCKWREKCELRCTLTVTAEGEIVYCERVSDARPVALKRRTYKYVEGVIMRLVDLIGFLDGRVRVYHHGQLVIDMVGHAGIFSFDQGNEALLDNLCWEHFAYIEGVFGIARNIVGVDIWFDDERED